VTAPPDRAAARTVPHPDRVPPAVACRLVTGPADLAVHAGIRRAVFVAEQGVFTGSDADVHDTDPRTLHVLGLVDGEPAGAVRLFPLDAAAPHRDWQGDRLAVLPAFRTSGLGAPLVRFAVATAAARGGRRMIAHVQPTNEAFFRRLGWTRRGEPELYVGLPHLLMDIEL
jgi:putative N-acetyltransferase (TIGR04045 family)